MQGEDNNSEDGGSDATDSQDVKLESKPSQVADAEQKLVSTRRSRAQGKGKDVISLRVSNKSSAGRQKNVGKY